MKKFILLLMAATLAGSACVSCKSDVEGRRKTPSDLSIAMSMPGRYIGLATVQKGSDIVNHAYTSSVRIDNTRHPETDEVVARLKTVDIMIKDGSKDELLEFTTFLKLKHRSQYTEIGAEGDDAVLNSKTYRYVLSGSAYYESAPEYGEHRVIKFSLRLFEGGKTEPKFVVSFFDGKPPGPVNKPEYLSGAGVNKDVAEKPDDPTGADED